MTAFQRVQGRWPAVRAAVIAGHALAAGTRLGARLAARAVMRRESRPSVVGRTLAELFQALGPCYVKIGQLLSTRRDLLDADVVRHLSRLTDQLPPGPFHVVACLFRRELGREVDDVFAELDPAPVASASVATVYRGRLRNGRTVAVKVRRPDVARRIEADLRLLRAAGALLARVPTLRLVPVAATLNDVCASLARQLDFAREAGASRRLRQALSVEAGVVVPALVDTLCGPSIITMEFIEGLHAPRAAGGEAQRAALRAAVRALYRMIFVEGCIHCDMHGGNLGLLADGRAALVDFGFVAEIGDAARTRFAEFFLAMSTGDGARCARITRDMARSLPPGFDYAAFEAEISELVGRVSRAKASEFRVADFVSRLFELQRRHRIGASHEFVMPVLSLLVLEGTVNEVYPELDFQREARPFVLRASVRPAPRPDTELVAAD